MDFSRILSIHTFYEEIMIYIPARVIHYPRRGKIARAAPILEKGQISKGFHMTSDPWPCSQAGRHDIVRRLFL